MDVKIASQCLYTGRALGTWEIQSVAYECPMLRKPSSLQQGMSSDCRWQRQPPDRGQLQLY